jgi:hypothetical protein
VAAASTQRPASLAAAAASVSIQTQASEPSATSPGATPTQTINGSQASSASTVNVFELQSALADLTTGVRNLSSLLSAQTPSAKIGSQIAALQSAISSQTYSAAASPPLGGGAPNTIAAASNIGQLSGTNISNPTITGGSISGATLSGTTLSAGPTTLASTTITGGLALTDGATFDSATSTNLYAASAVIPSLTATNATTTNFFATLANFGTGIFNSLTASIANVVGLTATNATTTNLIATNATSTNSFATTASSTNLFAQAASFGTLALASPLAASSGGTGINNPTSAGILLGSYAGGGWQQLATSSLGLLTTNVSEGSNLYFTNARADARINATSSIGTLLSAPNLTAVGTLSNLTATNATSTNLAVTGTASTSALVASNSLTFKNVTGFLKATAGAVATSLINLTGDVAGVLPVANGGTGWANLAAGAIPYGNGGSALATTTAGTAGYVLAYLNGIPTWAATTTLSTISGTLSASQGGTGQNSFGWSGVPVVDSGVWSASSTLNVYRGGTGAATFASNGILYGNGVGAIQALAVNSSATNKFLTQSSSGVPAWNTIAAGDLPGSFSGFANPTGTIGLTAANGSATTAMRSDAAPALSQAITPTWTSLHTFAAGFLSTASSTNVGAFTVSGATNLAALTASGNTSLQQATSTTLFSAVANFTSALASTLNASVANIVGFTATNATTTNLIATNATTTNFAALGTTYFGGNVGIGTTTPGSIFSVQGVANFASTSSTLYGNFNALGTSTLSSAAITSYPFTIKGNSTATGQSAYDLYMSSNADSVDNNGIAQFQTPTIDVGSNRGIDGYNPDQTAVLDVERMDDVQGGTAPYTFNTGQLALWVRGAWPEASTSISSTDTTVGGTSAGNHAPQDVAQVSGYGQGDTSLEVNGYGGMIHSLFVTTAAGFGSPANTIFPKYAVQIAATGDSIGMELDHGGAPASGELFQINSTNGQQLFKINGPLNAPGGSVTAGGAYADEYLSGNLLLQGNVGIGDTGPLTPLSVKTTQAKTTASLALVQRLGSGETYASNPFDLDIGMEGAATLANRYYSFQTSEYNIGYGGNLVFQANGGNVGVGTMTPYSRLEVWGPDSAASTTAFLVANNASTTEFAVLDNGNATLAHNLIQNSDQRLKTNVQALSASSSLAAIDSLNPITFNWIDSSQGSILQLGFIAQQVQQVFPNLVSTTSPTALTPDGTLSLNYIDLISPIVAAIQELDQELTSLAATVAGFAQEITSAIGNFGQVNAANELCVGSTCVTPAQFQAMVAAANQSASASAPASPSSSTSDATDTPPVIAINGDNPAIVDVGASYSDLGATITDPQADLNLGIRTFVNGAPMNPVVIDTSSVATDTIDYVVTDSQGLMSTSTRTVIVEPAAVPPILPPPASNVSSTTATSSIAG